LIKFDIMIVTISKGNFVKGLINYHEKKVERGVGALILDSTFSRNKSQRIAEFLDLADLNRKVKKARYIHMSVSFSQEDGVDREKQLAIADRYLEGMGYADAPRLIYEHTDTKHRHFHIVTSAVNLSGRKIAVFRDHFKNQELSRSIEKEFGLKVTEYFRQEQQKLQEINATKYGMLKAFQKMSSSPESLSLVQKIVGDAFVNKVLNEKLSNKEIEKRLIHDGDMSVYNNLIRTIKDCNAEYKTEKQELRDRLKDIKSATNNKEEFIQRCEEQGIYVRKISKEFGSASFTYGLKLKGFYVNEKDLPVGLRHDYLFTQKPITVTFDQADQRKFLKRIVFRQLKRSTSLRDFEARLLESGVKVKYDSNSRGPYGISFKSINIMNALPIKGSDIGLSWNTFQTFKFKEVTGDVSVEGRAWEKQKKIRKSSRRIG
jgi:hypothetical protein